MQKGEAFSIVLMMALLGFAVVIVDERWLRTAIAIVPALMLAQKSLFGSSGGQDEQTSRRSPSRPGERRVDAEVRQHVEELLRHFREFYTNVHMMGRGELSPEEAKGWAAQLERELNSLLARITDTSKAAESSGG
jgi:hypothetical protein